MAIDNVIDHDLDDADSVHERRADRPPNIGRAPDVVDAARDILDQLTRAGLDDVDLHFHTELDGTRKLTSIHARWPDDDSF